MAKFHINPETGKAGTCTASVKPCKYGAETPHFKSSAEAQSAYEESMNEQTITTHTRLTPDNAVIANAQMTVAKIDEFSEKLLKDSESKASKEHSSPALRAASKLIERAVSETNFSTAKNAERSLDRLETLRDELNHKAHELDSAGEHFEATSFWRASEGLGDLIVNNDS